MDIEVKNLIKAYGENLVLDRFSCTIMEGRVTCVTGPSGRGKTTLLRVLMDLEAPDGGTISGLDGKRLSAVFQEDRLCQNLSPVSNVRLSCAPGTSQEEILSGLRGVRLSGLSRPVRELSGGMRRRVAIIRSLLAEYEVLFLDEPFKGLDAATKETVIAYTRESSSGKTVVMVTHDLAEARAMGADMLSL